MIVLLTFVRRFTKPARGLHGVAAISRRLEDSTARARYWVRRMPREAVHLLQRIRLYNSAAAALSVFTGLLAWPVIADGSRLTAQVLLSTLSGLTALTVAAPYAAGLHDRAEESIKLCGTYGTVYGELLRAQHQLSTRPVRQSRVPEVIQQFDDITTRKDSLGLAAPAPGTDQEPGPRRRR